MQNRRAFRALFLSIPALILLIGCSGDDDCPTCPQVIQKGIMYGTVYTDGQDLHLYGDIYALDGSLPQIDSVTVAGYDLELTDYVNSGLEEYRVSYDGFAGDLSSGDTVLIEIYSPDGVCTSEVRLLDSTLDKAAVIGWKMESPFDTVALGADIMIDWHPVGNADWYIVSTSYDYDGASFEDEDHDYSITDTTFTISGMDTNKDGRYLIYITAVAGPLPDQPGGNIEGGIIKGRIISAAGIHFWIMVGSGF